MAAPHVLCRYEERICGAWFCMAVRVPRGWEAESGGPSMAARVLRGWGEELRAGVLHPGSH
jgi:hypothetical protein